MGIAIKGKAASRIDDSAMPVEIALLKGRVLVLMDTTAECSLLHREIAAVAPERRCVVIPSYELLPFDTEWPNSDTVAKRFAAFNELANENADILITTPDVCAEKLPPLAWWTQHRLVIHLHDTITSEQLVEQLAQWGYRADDNLQEIGTWVFRNQYTLDVRPPGFENVVRFRWNEAQILLWECSIDDGRKLHDLECVTLYPARAFGLNHDDISCFRKRYRHLIDDATKHSLYREITSALDTGFPEASAMLMPLFVEAPQRLTEIVGQETEIIVSDNALAMAKRWRQATPSRYRYTRRIVAEMGFELPVISELYWNEEPVWEKLEEHLPPMSTHESRYRPIVLANQFNIEHMLSDLENIAEKYAKIILCYTSEARLAILQTVATMLDWPLKLADSWTMAQCSKDRFLLLKAPIHRAFADLHSSVAVLTESAIFGYSIEEKEESPERSVLRDLYDLKYLRDGDPVVHLQHGIGRFTEMRELTLGDGTKQEYLKLEYADKGSVFVRLSDLDKVTRYAAIGDKTPPLHRLSDTFWVESLKAANQSIYESAKAVIKQSNQRARASIRCEIEANQYSRFEAEFPFTETRDQIQATEEILADLVSGRVMNRLLCGDVGFGKTEVAMRATFVVVENGYQVALLAPTTILAKQHYHTLRRRFASFPDIRIELLTGDDRASANRILSELQQGVIHIVVGTHRILQKDVSYHRLGMVIIDEEQRFGVQQKEVLARFHSEIHMLAMTATPIPRTLSSTLSGLRDVSIIATPPAKRIAVRTRIISSEANDNSVILTAVDREVMRGGQVFYVVNRIDGMAGIVEHLRVLRPDLRVGMAHGQMGDQLPIIMERFYRQTLDVLVCTTVIESGIDVANANTILIEQAENFGLAQLHQLRGRVGRSDRQAYAYLITVHESLPDDAASRLRAFAQTKSLGEGYFLAQQDLEIRGAGELLGEDQSGCIADIGYHLYFELLQRAVKMMRYGRHFVFSFENPAQIDVSVPGCLPKDWIGSDGERLSVYKHLANTLTHEELEAYQHLLVEIYGNIPDRAYLYLVLMHCRIDALMLGIYSVYERDEQWHLSVQRERADTYSSLLNVGGTPIDTETVMFKELGVAEFRALLSGIVNNNIVG